MMEHVASYYAASANPHAPYPQLNEAIRCDVCIVGGGFSGLSSALHLIEAGYDVVVLEAARIGWGASGRNGGQVVNSYSRDIDVIEARYGQQTAAMLGSMMFEGAEIIRQRIDRYAIACDYRPGAVSAALTTKQFNALKRKWRIGSVMATRNWNCWTGKPCAAPLPANAMSAGCWIVKVAICIR